MTIRQKNKRTMYKALKAFFTKWADVMKPITAFAAAFTQFLGLLDEIDAAADERNSAGAGTYTARDEASEALIDILLAVAAGLAASLARMV